MNEFTHRDQEIWDCLFKGILKPGEIARRTGRTLNHVYVYLHRLRLKTGVDLRNLAEVRKYGVKEKVYQITPTPTQERILKLLVDGWSHEAIALSLGISKQCSINQASLGIKRLGIMTRGAHRMTQLRGILAALDDEDGKLPSLMDADEFN